MDLSKFIMAACAAYVRTFDVGDQRPIDRKVNAALFEGFCRAADALGIAMTPTHFQMTFIEAHRATSDRPAWRAINNQAQRDWDAALANDVIRRLDLIGYVEAS